MGTKHNGVVVTPAPDVVSSPRAGRLGYGMSGAGAANPSSDDPGRATRSLLADNHLASQERDVGKGLSLQQVIDGTATGKREAPNWEERKVSAAGYPTNPGTPGARRGGTVPNKLLSGK